MVLVTFKGEMKEYMDFRDVVHATQSQMLKSFNGENVFQGRIIEVHIGTLLADQAFTFTDWTAEMKAKASICISENDTLIKSLEIAKFRIQIMIDQGMENDNQMLHRLIKIAENRILQIKSGDKPALKPDKNAKYFMSRPQSEQSKLMSYENMLDPFREQFMSKPKSQQSRIMSYGYPRYMEGGIASLNVNKK